jgi:hypothetical protein
MCTNLLIRQVYKQWVRDRYTLKTFQCYVGNSGLKASQYKKWSKKPVWELLESWMDVILWKTMHTVQTKQRTVWTNWVPINCVKQTRQHRLRVTWILNNRDFGGKKHKKNQEHIVQWYIVIRGQVQHKGTPYLPVTLQLDTYSATKFATDIVKMLKSVEKWRLRQPGSTKSWYIST